MKTSISWIAIILSISFNLLADSKNKCREVLLSYNDPFTNSVAKVIEKFGLNQGLKWEPYESKVAPITHSIRILPVGNTRLNRVAKRLHDISGTPLVIRMQYSTGSIGAYDFARNIVYFEVEGIPNIGERFGLDPFIEASRLALRHETEHVIKNKTTVVTLDKHLYKGALGGGIRGLEDITYSGFLSLEEVYTHTKDLSGLWVIVKKQINDLGALATSSKAVKETDAYYEQHLATLESLRYRLNHMETALRRLVGLFKAAEVEKAYIDKAYRDNEYEIDISKLKESVYPKATSPNMLEVKFQYDNGRFYEKFVEVSSQKERDDIYQGFSKNDTDSSVYRDLRSKFGKLLYEDAQNRLGYIAAQTSEMKRTLISTLFEIRVFTEAEMPPMFTKDIGTISNLGDRVSRATAMAKKIDQATSESKERLQRDLNTYLNDLGRGFVWARNTMRKVDQDFKTDRRPKTYLYPEIEKNTALSIEIGLLSERAKKRTSLQRLDSNDYLNYVKKNLGRYFESNFPDVTINIRFQKEPFTSLIIFDAPKYVLEKLLSDTRELGFSEESPFFGMRYVDLNLHF